MEISLTIRRIYLKKRDWQALKQACQSLFWLEYMVFLVSRMLAVRNIFVCGFCFLRFLL